MRITDRSLHLRIDKLENEWWDLKNKNRRAAIYFVTTSLFAVQKNRLLTNKK
jgi:hypothetical protein